MPRQALFHAQQTAEKAIKAIFVFLQTELPYTHDLDRLRNLLPAEWKIKEDPPDLSELTFWTTRGRYPGSSLEATEDEARTAIEQARNVYETALTDLENHGYDRKGDEVRDEPAEEES